MVTARTWLVSSGIFVVLWLYYSRLGQSDVSVAVNCRMSVSRGMECPWWRKPYVLLDWFRVFTTWAFEVSLSAIALDSKIEDMVRLGCIVDCNFRCPAWHVRSFFRDFWSRAISCPICQYASLTGGYRYWVNIYRPTCLICSTINSIHFLLWPHKLCFMLIFTHH